VATGEVDVGLGTDTGGSVRLPAAACGIVGLKTTWGRVPLGGIQPLSPSLDTVGPLARDVAGVVAGMALLEPGFTPDRPALTDLVVGRLHVPFGVHPAIDAAVDDALARLGVTVVDVTLGGWAEQEEAFVAVIMGEGYRALGHLAIEDPAGVGDQVRGRLMDGASVGPDALVRGRAGQSRWSAIVEEVFAAVHVLALPTLREDPDPIGAPGIFNGLTFPFNLAGTPALSLPVGHPPGLRVPASLQVVGPRGADELVCAVAALVEAAQA